MTRIPFGMMLKTYSKDYEYAKRLVNSLKIFNLEKIPLTIVAPMKEISLFETLSCDFVNFIPEEEISDCLIHDGNYWGLPIGYVNQEIIKLAFWEVCTYENYLCLDSDCVFIRKFKSSDFMFDRSTPYLFVSEDNELKVDGDYYNKYWQQREMHLKTIQEIIDYHPPYLLTCHGFSVLSRTVLMSLKNDFMIPRGLKYNDLIKTSPYEFSWYNFWVLKNKIIPIHLREPIIKTFHSKSQHIAFIRSGATSADLARGYVAVVVNSNFSRDYGLINIDDAATVYSESWLIHFMKLTKYILRKIYNWIKHFLV